MNNYSSLFVKLFEKNAVTTVCVIVLAVVVVTGIWLYRKHTKTDNSPDLMDYDGYYKITLTPTGFAPTDRNKLFKMLSGFYYLRKDSFGIEVSIDEIQADNGKKYRALALATVILPEDRIDFVCKRYFSSTGNRTNNADIMAAMTNRRSGSGDTVADILSGQRQNEKANSDEMLKQILNGNIPAATDKKRRQEKKICDADIDMDLTIAFSSSLKKLIKEQGGTMTTEELKKKFLGQAMLEAMSTGHAVIEIPVFNIIEITD